MQAANKAHPDGYKYHAVGGASATVSPMGWTFSCGLSGTTAGRALGFGVDQVVQVEMVLPNGQHVKFGPTEWESVDGYDVPKTLSVSGLCNANPEGAEDDWEWAPCSEDINFDDLWFAVRGGGGGTWGIVTSIVLQLHEWQPLERTAIRYDACVQEKLDKGQLEFWARLAQKFEILFLLDPTSIGVSEAQSNACGRPGGDFAFSCYGEGSGMAFVTAWKQYLSDNRNVLEGVGIVPAIIDEALNCQPEFIDGTSMEEDFFVMLTPGTTFIMKYKDFAESNTFPPGYPYAGRPADSPAPRYSSENYDTANILIPRQWILDDLDFALDFIPPSGGYLAFGGKTASAASDQFDSLSSAHRDTGYMFGFPYFIYGGDDFFSLLFPTMFDTRYAYVCLGISYLFIYRTNCFQSLTHYCISIPPFFCPIATSLIFQAFLEQITLGSIPAAR